VVEPPHHRKPPLPPCLKRGESRFAAHGNALLQHGVIPGSSHPMALGISSPGLDEVDLM
jgi:hypothetical protein